MVRDAGNRIRQARKGAGLSQTELARKVGVSVTTVSDWETGKYAPTMRHLAALSKVLRKDPLWFMGGSDCGRVAGTAAGDLSVEDIDRLMDLLRDAKRAIKGQRARTSGEDVREASAEGADALRTGAGGGAADAGRTGSPAGGGGAAEACSLPVLESALDRMPRFENPKAPISGMVAADTGEGRRWIAEPEEPGGAAGADAQDPRLVRVRGASAEEFARDGQHVLIDAACTNVSVGEVCVVLTRDGALRLKRKLPDESGNRRYQSINPAYPPLIVPARQVVAEFPVCAVITKAKLISPAETQDEEPPPGGVP